MRVGLAAMHWRRLDLEALRLQTLAAGRQVTLAKWRKAASAAAGAHVEFTAFLADSIAEQEVMEGVTAPEGP